jgi:hypothetical protein
MSGVRIDTSQVDAALAKVKRAAKDLTEANRLAATALLPGVRQRTPHRTGDLSNSWEVEADDRGGRIVSTLDYANLVEDGSKNMSGAHMGRETVDASDRDLVEAYEQALTKALHDAGFETR